MDPQTQNESLKTDSLTIPRRLRAFIATRVLAAGDSGISEGGNSIHEQLLVESLLNAYDPCLFYCSPVSE